MQFKQILGQQHIQSRLVDGVKENRISHAQLFVGQLGHGMLPMALAYAQYVNCKNPGETDSCGECSSCKKMQKLIHPDLHFVFPVVKTKSHNEPVSDNFLPQWRERVLKTPYFDINQWFSAIDVENAQGQIYVHESSEILRKLNLKTYESEYKVMVIWMADRMNVQCANKLLKMIEEPPPKTLFILITDNEEKIISTIRSRTQLVKFSAIDEASMQQAIENNPLAAGKNIPGLIHLSNGNYIKTLELLSPSVDTHQFFELFGNIMRITYKRDWPGLFALVDELANLGRERQKNFLQYGLHMVRENFILNLKQPNLNYLNDEEHAFSARFSPFINERNVVLFTEEFEKAFRDITQNGNPRIIFLDMGLKITKFIKA
jgi:DNA polymerase III subunit delta'